MSNPKKNGGHTFNVYLPETGSAGVLKVNPTIAAGDFQISGESGTFTNLTNLPTVSPAGSEQVEIILTAAETNYDWFTVRCKDAAGGEWDTVAVHYQTDVNTIDDVDALIDAIKAVTDLLPNAGALTDLATAANLATVDANVDAILLDTSTDGVAISTATMQTLADEVIGRDASNVEDTAGEHSLAAVPLAIFKGDTTDGISLVVYKTDGVTQFASHPLTTDPNADPITKVS